VKFTQTHKAAYETSGNFLIHKNKKALQGRAKMWGGKDGVIDNLPNDYYSPSNSIATGVIILPK